MLPQRNEPPEPPSPRAVLEVAQALARELQPQRKSWSSLTLDLSLERDLGLDSLGRVELLARLERSFAVRLPEAALGSAETPRDLLQALLRAIPRPLGGAAHSHPAEPLAAAEAAPDRTRSLSRCWSGTPSATRTGGTSSTWPARASPRS